MNKKINRIISLSSTVILMLPGIMVIFGWFTNNDSDRKLFAGFTTVIILITVLNIFSSYYSDKCISTTHSVEDINNVLSEVKQMLSLTMKFKPNPHACQPG